jgi:hypothetical protein
MGNLSLVTTDMLLRWAEVLALSLSVVLVAAVLIFLATVLHVTRDDGVRPRPPKPTQLVRGRRAAHTMPGI